MIHVCLLGASFLPENFGASSIKHRNQQKTQSPTLQHSFQDVKCRMCHMMGKNFLPLFTGRCHVPTAHPQKFLDDSTSEVSWSLGTSQTRRTLSGFPRKGRKVQLNTWLEVPTGHRKMISSPKMTQKTNGRGNFTVQVTVMTVWYMKLNQVWGGFCFSIVVSNQFELTSLISPDIYIYIVVLMGPFRRSGGYPGGYKWWFSFTYRTGPCSVPFRAETVVLTLQLRPKASHFGISTHSASWLSAI